MQAKRRTKTYFVARMNLERVEMDLTRETDLRESRLIKAPMSTNHQENIKPVYKS